MFAQTAKLCTIDYDPESWSRTREERSQEYTIPPQVLVDSTATTGYDAIEKAYEPTLNIEGIKQLATRAGCVIVSDVPDNCNANRRLG